MHTYHPNKRWLWHSHIDPHRAYCRAGGRRRYNAERQRRADQRRVIVAGMLWQLLFRKRGLIGALARHLGVHRSTIWRDVKRLTWPHETNYIDQQGNTLWTIQRAYRKGPILNVTDPDGNEIRGAARRDILRRLKGWW